MAGFNLNIQKLVKTANNGFGKFVLNRQTLVPFVGQRTVTAEAPPPTPSSDIAFVNAVAQSSIGNRSGVASDNISSIDNITF